MFHVERANYTLNRLSFQDYLLPEILIIILSDHSQKILVANFRP